VSEAPIIMDAAGACRACGARIAKNERVIEAGKLYTELKDWRKTKLQEKGVNVLYIVASNRTLRDISVFRPQSKEQMLAIHGIGETRYTEYDFNEVLEIIRDREEESHSLVDYCDGCPEGSAQASGAPPPNDPQISSHGGGSSCPTCGGPWDGVSRNHSASGTEIWPLPHSDHFNIQYMENTDSTDDQLAIAKGGRVLDVEIRGISLEILSRTVDHYLQQSSVDRVFDSGDYSSSFTYTPEWVSRPLETMGAINGPGFWRCRLSHTITNKGSCHSCGDDVKNQSHNLCYPCWKRENRG